MYDFLPDVSQNSVEFDSDVYMANVFEAKNNCSVRFIGLELADGDTDVEYSVYLLKDDAESPIDGFIFAEASEHFDYAGYHTVDLGRTIMIPHGMKYSVVVKVGKDEKSELLYCSDLNRNGIEYYGIDDEVSFYAKTVVNPGESYVGTSLDSSKDWTDRADIIGRLEKYNKKMNNNGFCYDNFPIRSYPQTETFTIVNYSESEDKQLNEGDVIEGKVFVTNNCGYDLTDDFDFEVVLSICDIGENNKDAKSSGIKAGETKTFSYSYTVTADDVKAGSIECSAVLKLDGEQYDNNSIFGEWLTYTVYTSGKTTGEKNPATGTEAQIAVAAVILLGVAVLFRRQSK